MKFLLDENIDARLELYLLGHGHDVTAIGRHYPVGLGDQDVLHLAETEQRILLTGDRDFGELVFANRRPHAGIILFRIDPLEPLDFRLIRLAYVLEHFDNELDQFLVCDTNASPNPGEPTRLM